ncbi:MAG: T9SS type A sorting domain-containing protein, partial [Pedobacter sp.]
AGGGLRQSTANSREFPTFWRVPGLPQSVRVDMILPNADSTYSVIDGTLSTFDESYSSDVDYSDAGKLTNTGENIAFKINNQLIAIERRKNVTAADTLFLNISQMKYQTYQLQVTMENMDSDGNLAFLKDNFMPSNNIPLNMNGVTTVPFSITTATGSWAPNRFSIVFAPAVIVPLLVTKIKATPVGKNIRVDWAVEYEMNLSHYEVQKSVDGISFNVIGQVATRNTGNSALYDMIDENVVKGMNYYRIVAVERDGTKVKTDVVSVNIKEESVKQSINIFPNPVTNNKIQLQFVGQQTGLYAVRLTNIAGQVLYTGGLSLSSGTSTKVVEPSTILTPGVYQLEIYGPDHSQQTQKLIVQ